MPDIHSRLANDLIRQLLDRLQVYRHQWSDEDRNVEQQAQIWLSGESPAVAKFLDDPSREG